MRDLKKRLRSRHIRSVSGRPEPRRGRPESPRNRDSERKTVFKRLEKGVFHRLREEGKNVSSHSDDSRRQSYYNSRRDTESCYQSSRSIETESSFEKHHNKIASLHRTEALSESEDDDLSQPWVCEETDPFTPRIRYFDLPKRTRMPSHVKTYDGSEDLEDHLKIFQAAEKVERWAMLTWCHMFNSILTGSARKKCIKDPVEIHHIKQREGESTGDSVRRFKVESRDVKGAPEIMRISGFMHGITNPELIKRLHDKILKSVDEMMRITTSFLKGEVAAGNQERKKSLSPWKQQEAEHRHYFKKKREVGHNTDECMHLKRQIKELMKNGKLSHVIKELKQNSRKDQLKANKKGETSKISFPPLEEEEDSHLRTTKSSEDRESEVLSTTYGMIKFLIAGGVITLRSSKIIPIECAAVSGPEGKPPAAHQDIEERIKIAINPEYPEQTIMIGYTLIEEGRNKLCDLLQRNLDVFAWKPADMTDVPRHIAEHRLNIREGCPSVKQKRRSQASDRNQAIQEEVKKLVDAGIMKEVHYHNWSSNLVMVKKHNDSWRMCVDFKDLNKAFPKDGYPLAKIDWKVESLCGFPFKCFLDAYKGYHQINMAKEDEEKTSFIKIQGVFCYSKMPFGLRNVGATYHRLVDKAFHKKIGWNLEVYVDDLVIKIQEGMFLGYKVNTKGIMVCSDKVDAVLSLPSPKCLKDVQKLNGKLASLDMFLAKYAEKSLSFFKTLKKCAKKSDFHWTKEAEAAFKQMKQLIAELPTLTAPEEKEELIVYLAAAKEAVSAVLMTEREAKQMPIYFVSRTLRGLEVNYTSMEKLVLALVHASKHLKSYFQAHPIIVVTDQPIKQVLSKPKVAGRLQKWSIELGEYVIHYRPRVSVKGQILADFLVERPEKDDPDTARDVEDELPKPWNLFTDGSSYADGSGAGLILTNPEGAEFTSALRFRFEATNNEAEYEALIAGLRITEEMGVTNLQANVDSRLVANQVNGTYIAKEADMIRYLEKVRTLTNGFRMFSIKQVPRSENKKADALSKIASTSFAHLSKQVLVEELKEKSINKLEVLAVVEEEGNTWMTPIYEYLTEETLPAEVNKARAVRRKSQRFAVINGVLYKKSFLGPWLRSVVAKALGTGYYWPTMDKDARALIRACQDCQVHKPILRNLQQKLTPITSLWPFYKWGIDIAEPFSEGPSKVKFLIVAIDYFTKWIEAKPVATITGSQVKKFVWDNIVCRLGLPGEIISDN
ncbi:reverse transcriptase domain-containing protein [Tanacetum coccineum]